MVNADIVGLNAGMDIDTFAPRLSFFWGIGMHFYMVSSIPTIWLNVCCFKIEFFFGKVSKNVDVCKMYWNKYKFHEEIGDKIVMFFYFDKVVDVHSCNHKPFFFEYKYIEF